MTCAHASPPGSLPLVPPGSRLAAPGWPLAGLAGQAGTGTRSGVSPRDRGDSSRTTAATSGRSRCGGDSASANPRSHLPSAKYSGDPGSAPAGRVREPEKLTRAPGTPMSTSALAVSDAQTPPVVGSPATAMCGMPALLGGCDRRRDGLHLDQRARAFLHARPAGGCDGHHREAFGGGGRDGPDVLAPSAAPSDPPKKPNSKPIRTQGSPPTVARPVVTACLVPVLSLAWRSCPA